MSTCVTIPNTLNHIFLDQHKKLKTSWNFKFMEHRYGTVDVHVTNMRQSFPVFTTRYGLTSASSYYVTTLNLVFSDDSSAIDFKLRYL